MHVDLGAIGQQATDYTKVAALVAGALVLGWLVHAALHALIQRIARASVIEADEVLVASLKHPARWTIVTVALALAARRNEVLLSVWNWLEPFVVPALLGWIAVSLVRAVALLLEKRSHGSADPQVERSRRTRIAIFSRTAGVLIAVPGVREIGVTLMASAGLAGLAVGAAAQPALKSLIAGLQIALTEPIRLGDYVSIEGDNGTVDDIRMTYVVIRTGDNRRLIVPTAKFLDTSFHNWTHAHDPLLGTVLLPVREGTAIEPLRETFEALVKHLPDWDGASASVSVGEVRPGSIELRLSASAKDPAALGRLRLSLREGMTEWLRINQPEALVGPE
jgi:small-conductance mechanosensitive channel